MTLPNGVVATLSYDAASQLTQMVYQGGTQGTQNLIYTYDLAGRRVGVSGSLAKTQLPAAVSNASYNANNQLTQWGSTAMTYDANGSTLSDGMNTYVWDARNRLVSADNNAATFAYDPFGRRVSKTVLSTTTNFLYDGANAVQEYGTNPTANLLTGGLDERFQRTSSTETDDYLTDALGSTLELTNATGATEEQYSYSPYGSLSATGETTTNSYTYTGRESDGLGVDYYRARYYSPTTGRFLSEDPLGFAGSGPNLYEYADDDPVDFRDPYGLSFGSSFGEGFVNGAVSTAVVVLGTAALVAAAPEIAGVVTGVALVTGAAGLVSTGVSLYSDPSADNFGYSLGALTGSGIVGGMNGLEMSRLMSPEDFQPNPNLGPLDSTLQNAWRDPQGNINPLAFLNDWLRGNPNGVQPMETGPDPYGAGAGLAGQGNGLAQLMNLFNHLRHQRNGCK